MSETLGIKGFVYTTIPEWVLDADISPYSVRLFGVLNRYIGHNEAAWPSRKTLAERMHCSVDRVDDSIKELESIGAVHIERRQREDGSFGSNYYYLWPLLPEGVAANLLGGSRQSPIGVAANLLQHERTLNKRALKKDTSPTVERKSRYTQKFEVLWNIYPRKIDKAGAFKAYKARINEGATFEQLLEATENYAKTRAGQDENYTMHAKTFFGPNGRYADFLASQETAYVMTEKQLQDARDYDSFDRNGVWRERKTGEPCDSSPAKYGISRPTDDKGNLLDALGRRFKLDNLGQRHYTD